MHIVYLCVKKRLVHRRICMLDIVRRILVVVIMGMCIGLLFVGGTMAKAQASTQWNWPTEEGTLTDMFGSRNAKHFGIDIAAPVGTQVYAVYSGRVTKSYYSDTYGQVVFIKQDNGYETVYAHLNNRGVAEGERISARQTIGQVGNTGRSSGAHLHFEVHKGTWNIDKTNAINPIAKLDQEKLSAYVTEQLEAAVFRQLNEGYVVERGDTLSEIAKKYKIDVDDLKGRNHMTTSDIYPGQHLKITK